MRMYIRKRRVKATKRKRERRLFNFSILRQISICDILISMFLSKKKFSEFKFLKYFALFMFFT